MDISSNRSRHALPLAASIGIIVVAVSLPAASPQAESQSWTREAAAGAVHEPIVERGQRLFYNGDYEQSAVVADVLCAAGPDGLEACELRSASLLFQIKKALADTGERDKATAWKRCGVCPALLSAFQAATLRGQALARARLTRLPDDEEALFFLGKIDLNYVWLHSGTLGRKTGWDEYWEARRSLDRVLQSHAGNVRARVARAWVDYIVGSTVPMGVRWILGGGNKQRGLRVVREVVQSGDGEFFEQAEAMFALWEMQVRERQIARAIATARALAAEFPDNLELRSFLALRDPTSPAIIPELPTR